MTKSVTPKDMLAGRQQEIHGERDRKLEAARKQRQIRREQAAWILNRAAVRANGALGQGTNPLARESAARGAE